MASKTELLDRVLEGKSPEIKARVLDLIVRMGIDPEDEFFLIFIALGQLQVLIEDSPRDWQQLFTDFKEELRLWEESNLRTLDHLTQQVQVMERLAKGVNRLIVVMQPLAQNSPQLQENWQKLSGDLVNLRETARLVLTSHNRHQEEITLAKQTLSTMRTYAPHQERLLNDLLAELMQHQNILRSLESPPSPNGISNFFMAFGGALAAIVFFQVMIAPLFMTL
ncbi:hypothetical protein IQ273_07720 [Nodosilinea sp. LEGE 07298]|uniref:DUF6753 family protein n=1 Tax=Nodosilinea sp. LEGE 07298 TaxID=2777970 RepID=UPI0018805A0E|nr:DUF6753 family protein [Nodosilinea sp. LEGE 07298]MBE9109301.1 hypothetical protein [Nodosilinea sp. LEGE 07298]